MNITNLLNSTQVLPAIGPIKVNTTLGDLLNEGIKFNLTDLIDEIGDTNFTRVNVPLDTLL